MFSESREHFCLKDKYYPCPDKKEFSQIEKLFPGCFIAYDKCARESHFFEASNRKRTQYEALF